LVTARGEPGTHRSSDWGHINDCGHTNLQTGDTQIFRLGTHQRLWTHKFADRGHTLRPGTHKRLWTHKFADWGHTYTRTGDTQSLVSGHRQVAGLVGNSERRTGDTQIFRLGTHKRLWTHKFADRGHTL